MLQWEFGVYNRSIILLLKACFLFLHESLKQRPWSHVAGIPDNLIKGNALTHIFHHRQDLKGRSNSDLLHLGSAFVYWGILLASSRFASTVDPIEQYFSICSHDYTLRNLFQCFLYYLLKVQYECHRCIFAYASR